MMRNKQKTVLKAFQRALSQERHNLLERPEILWQQMYNRLQWADGKGKERPVAKTIGPDFEKRTAPGAKPWLHNRCRTMESENLIMVLTGHTKLVNSCAFSPDGKTLASGSNDGTVRLWDLRKGKIKAVLKGHTQKVKSCAFSPDGKTLASTGDSKDNTIRLWDVGTGTERAVLKGHTFCVFSPDGKALASASSGRRADSTVSLRDVATGRERAVLKGHTFCVFSPDGKTLVSAGYDKKTVNFWDVKTARQKGVLKIHVGTRDIYSCAFSPNSEMLAFTGDSEWIMLWDGSKNKHKFLKGHTRCVLSCAFSPDGKTLASASEDKTVTLWNLKSLKQITVLKGHTGEVTSCVFSPDGKTLASASWDRTVRLWDSQTRKKKSDIKGQTDEIYFCAFSPGGEILASFSEDRSVRFFDMATGAERVINITRSYALSPDGKTLAFPDFYQNNKLISLFDMVTGTFRAPLKGHTYEVTSCAYSPDGKLLASASKDNTVRLWDLVKGTEQAVLKGHTGSVTCIFSPDGETLVLKGYKTIKLWDLKTERHKKTLKNYSDISRLLTVIRRIPFFDGRITSSAFSPDCKTLASGSNDGTVRLWDLKKGKIKALLKGHTHWVTSCVFSPDGKTLASKCECKDNIIRLWDVGAGRERTVLKGHTNKIKSYAFSTDGKTLVSAGMDKTVRFWDVATGRKRALLEGHTHWVNSCVFSPDGKTLATAGEDMTIRLWNVAQGKQIYIYPCIGQILTCIFNPSGKTLVAGDKNGNVYILDLIGFEFKQLGIDSEADSLNIQEPKKVIKPFSIKRGKGSSFERTANLVERSTTPIRAPAKITSQTETARDKAVPVPPGKKLAEQKATSPGIKVSSNRIEKNNLGLTAELKKVAWGQNVFSIIIGLLMIGGGYALVLLSMWFLFLSIPMFISAAMLILIPFTVSNFDCPHCSTPNAIRNKELKTGKKEIYCHKCLKFIILINR